MRGLFDEPRPETPGEGGDRPTPREKRRVYTVSELNALAQAILEESFPSVWVEGEISNLRKYPSGHTYFTLKDEAAQIAAVLFRRFANLEVVLAPSRVQGEGASLEIVESIRMLNHLGGIDVLILARGGGSIEDLWPFNEERVARAIAASGVPVVSAVGHEVDTTIADLVADLRAPTPSAAAEMVVQSKEELADRIGALRGRLVAAARLRLSAARDTLDEAGSARAG